MKHQLSLFFALLFLLPLNSWAGNLYIMYDGGCMDRLEYSYENDSKKKDYVVYHVNLSNSEKIILEVGIESNESQNYLPAQILQCNNSIFDRRFVQSINNQIDKVYLVRKKGRKKYTITPIAFAAYYKTDKEIIEYDSPKYKFKFDLLRGAVGEDLNYIDPNSEIFFEGKLDYHCTGAYLFRQVSDFNNPHTDIVFVPKVGVIEERSGRDIDDAFNNALSLKTINNSDVDQYFDVLCGTDDGIVLSERGVQDEPDFEENVIINQPQPDESFTNTNLPQVRYHNVQKGETLYGISKKYGVKVEQLRDWNNLGTSNLIKKGQQLKVSPGTTQNAPVFNTNPSRPINTNTSTVNRGTNNTNNQGSRIITTQGSRISGTTNTQEQFFSRGQVKPAVTAPAPYSNQIGRIQTNNDTERYHMVKAGETMASIAMKYGYTATKLRQINSMNNNDVPLIGQRLIVSECNCPNNEVTKDAYNGTPSNFSVRPQHNLQPTDYSSSAYSPRIYTEKSVPDSYNARVGRIYTNDNEQEEEVEPIFSPSGRKMHMVREGENLYQIAKRYGVTVEHLMRVNDFGINEVLIPFQKIYIN